MERGATVQLDALWRLTRPWYADRLDERWSPKTADTVGRLLADAGFTGNFWSVT